MDTNRNINNYCIHCNNIHVVINNYLMNQFNLIVFCDSQLCVSFPLLLAVRPDVVTSLILS